MKFTYDGYRSLLSLLQEKEYTFCDYENHSRYSGKKCILRHDIDMSIEKALKLAEIENQVGVSSTWFVLVTSDFYNPLSKDNLVRLKKLVKSGEHRIGLHFDLTTYEGESFEHLVNIAEKEKLVLETMLDTDVYAVSMHRPTVKAIEKELEFKGMINSYAEEFFSEYKYVSDSRRNWKNPILDMISLGEYERLHILTHPIWYNETEKEFVATLEKYVDDETINTKRWLRREISNLEGII